ncbi:MAG: hypothetical protein A3H27_15735 [Acidobacteria bacterium RIFCSPLOWO2_02_FULL_59_13]|nr:MAG: hypothetical protein A3H27_15735 [Acidobacteria bacterium RIFCSPLOWO2_02_FULL_59_13]
MKKQPFVLPVLLAFAFCTVHLLAFAQEMNVNGLDRNKDRTFTGNEWRGDSWMIPKGTEFAVRSNETINSRTDFVGQLFLAVIERAVFDRTGALAIPKGSDAELVLQKAMRGSMTTASELVLDLEAVTIAGLRYLVITGDVEEKDQQGIGANGGTREIVGRGWAQGALNGAIASGGEAAVIIAGLGAAAGAGGRVLTKGKEVRVPAETVLNFTLAMDVRLEPSR